MKTNNVKCPDCGASIELTPKPGNPLRLAAFCSCCNRGKRQVYETDAPAYPPVAISDRIDQSEHAAKPKFQRSNK